ncbi:LuxR family transcriptional regulator [Ornithinimicrobium ciconiae]|uniref:LuxR family transcriptional regulator n=1 Tax=Ornithinimicrobium ciconiae TaxID=2594265 RepID=A0A516G9F6_9MICO|nr:LuxR C-terminal-related transcriptional regulator [Ornithinimicrobium ciconiae]QDO88158.1 LuxR family transcriptional regulator [Ornithinimicrobium ciconiae]
MPWRKMLHAREDLLRTARRLLAQDSTRVLTLTGLPGVGRTSMARALVNGAPPHHEVPFVDARRATQPGALCRIVLEAAALSDVVVVDDADTAPDAAHALARALATQRDAQLIVTASAPLHLPAEAVVRVPALPEPDLSEDPETYAGQPAVRLFLDRAERSGAMITPDRETLEDIAAICSALGGNPGAIVMAAARTPTLPPAMLRELLTESPPSTVIAAQPLSGSRDLFTAIAWSESLLDEAPRALLADLAVFASSVPLEAVAEVTEQDGLVNHLAALVDSHLVEPLHYDTGSAYRLSPLVRERAAQLLSHRPERAAELSARHTQWALGVAHQSRMLTVSGMTTDALGLAAELEPEIMAALQRSVDGGDVEVAAQLLLGIVPCWFSQAVTAQEKGWIDRVLGLAEEHEIDQGLRAMLLAWRGLVGAELATDAAGVAAALPDLQAARELAEPLGEQLLTRVLMLSVLAGRVMGDRSAVEPLCRQGQELAEQLGDVAAMTSFEAWAGMLAHQRGDVDEALRCARAAFERAQRLRNPRVMLLPAALLRTLPPGTPIGSDVPSFAELLDSARLVQDNRSLSWILPSGTMTALHAGDLDTAATLALEALRHARASGNPRRYLTPTLTVLLLAHARGDAHVATRLRSALRPFSQVLLPAPPPWMLRDYGETISGPQPDLALPSSHQEALALLQGAGEDALRYVRSLATAPVIRMVAPLEDTTGLRPRPEDLTEREREVLASLPSGASNKELSVQLGISAKTVMHHTSSIYRKLGVRGRSEAISWVLRHEDVLSEGVEQARGNEA